MCGANKDDDDDEFGDQPLDSWRADDEAYAPPVRKNQGTTRAADNVEFESTRNPGGAIGADDDMSSDELPGMSYAPPEPEPEPEPAAPRHKSPVEEEMQILDELDDDGFGDDDGLEYDFAAEDGAAEPDLDQEFDELDELAADTYKTLDQW